MLRKLIGKKEEVVGDQTNQQENTIDVQQEQRHSSFFSRSKSTETTDKNGSDDDSFNALVILMNGARRRFLKKGLEGEITISRLTGIVTSSVSCEVSANDKLGQTEEEEEEEEKTLAGHAADALSSTEAIISSLLYKSKSWAALSYAEDLSLSSDVTVGFYMPFLVIVGFSITIELRATVSSLNKCNLKLAEEKRLKKRLNKVDSGGEMVDELVRQGFTVREARRAVDECGGISYEQALEHAIRSAETPVQESVKDSSK